MGKILKHLYLQGGSYTLKELSDRLEIGYPSVYRAIKGLDAMGVIRWEGKKVAWFEDLSHYHSKEEYEIFLRHSKNILRYPHMEDLKRLGDWENVVSHLSSDREFRELHQEWTKIDNELTLQKEKLRRVIEREARRIGLRPAESVQELENRGAILVGNILASLPRLEPEPEDLPLPPLEYREKEFTRREAFLRKLLPLPPPNHPPKIGRRRLTGIIWRGTRPIGYEGSVPREKVKEIGLIGYREFVDPEKVRKLINYVLQSHEMSRVWELEAKLDEITEQIDKRLEWFAARVKDGEPLPGRCQCCPKIRIWS